MEKQRIAEEVASILKLSVDISTAQSKGLFCCLLISFSLYANRIIKRSNPQSFP
jgi:hypothetical protein